MQTKCDKTNTNGVQQEQLNTLFLLHNGFLNCSNNIMLTSRLKTKPVVKFQAKTKQRTAAATKI